MEYAGKSLKSQLRRADKLGARRVLILGGDELARGIAQLRDMAAGTQEEVPLADIENRVRSKIVDALAGRSI
jgi:histidyl-tRNA synthetase